MHRRESGEGYECRELLDLICIGEIAYEYSIDDLLSYVLMLTFEEDSWLVGWSLSRLLASYVPCYSIVLKQLNDYVLKDELNENCDLSNEDDQRKFCRLFILTYTVYFLISIKSKISLCSKAKNVERDSLDRFTQCYLLEDQYEYCVNEKLLDQILDQYLHQEGNKTMKNYGIYQELKHWLDWRVLHSQLLSVYMNDPSNSIQIEKLTEKEDHLLTLLTKPSLPYDSFESYQKAIPSSLYDSLLYKLLPTNIPTNVPRYNKMSTSLKLLSESVHVYQSLYSSIRVENDFISMFGPLSHIIFTQIYPYTRAALYVSYLAMIDNKKFDWNTYLCRCFHINKNRNFYQQYHSLCVYFMEIVKDTIHSICLVPHMVYKQIPVLLTQWTRFYENYVYEVNQLDKKDPLYIYLITNEIQKNITHFVLNTCCYMLILYTYLDIYLKLSSKYDIGFMVWYD